MNTQKHSRRKHRLLVAGPLFGVLFALSLSAGFRSLPLNAELTGSGHMVSVDAKAAPRIIRVEGGQMEVGAGGVVHNANALPVLVQGTLLVHAESLVRLQVGDTVLQGWNGSFQVSAQGTSVTIAALSTPVSVKQGTERTVVPAYMQWKEKTLVPEKDGFTAWYASRVSKDLPADFIREQLKRVSAFPKEETLSVDSPSYVPQDSGILRVFKLSAAKKREDAQIVSAKVKSLVEDALLQNADAFANILQTPDLQQLLRSTEGEQVVPQLLAAALSHGKDGVLLPAFVQKEDLQLLALFHPLIRDHAWVVPGVSLYPGNALIALGLLPLSDMRPESVNPLAVRSWQTDWSAYMHTESGAIAAFKDSLPFAREQVLRLDERHFPERVDTYTTSILALADEWRPFLNDTDRAVVARIENIRNNRRSAAPIADVAVTASGSVASGTSSSASSAPAVDPTVLVEQARTMLGNAGFMLTSQSTFEPVSNAVRVSSVIFGSAQGDIALRFTFDPLNNAVSDIEREGKTLPYTITLQAFTEWMKTK